MTGTAQHFEVLAHIQLFQRGTGRTEIFAGVKFGGFFVEDFADGSSHRQTAVGVDVDFAETCVFAKQSLGPFHCGLVSQAPLIPKLRGQLAEFLNNPSPVGLRILSSSTCVGLRYGHLTNIITMSISRSRPQQLAHVLSLPTS